MLNEIAWFLTGILYGYDRNLTLKRNFERILEDRLKRSQWNVYPQTVHYYLMQNYFRRRMGSQIHWYSLYGNNEYAVIRLGPRRLNEFQMRSRIINKRRN